MVLFNIRHSSDYFDSPNFEIQNNQINYSIIDYGNYTKIWVQLSNHEIILKSLTLIPIILFGLFGNGAVISFVIRNKRLHTCPNFFICNMALADLMTILFCSWTIIILDGFQNFILGRTYCRVDGFIHLTCLLSSIFSLVVISADRLLGVVFPFSTRLSKGQTIVIMVAIWAAAMICASPVPVWRKLQTRPWKDYTEIWCNENTHMLKYYWFIILTLLVYVPLTVMLVVYIVIIMQMEKYEHQLFLKDHPLKIKYRRKVIKVLFLYVLNFLICWVPFQVMMFYRYFKPQKNDLGYWHSGIFFVGHYLANAQSAINPIIYGVCNKNFRKTFRKTFRCFFRNNKIKPVLNNLPIRLQKENEERNREKRIPKPLENLNQERMLQINQETELKDISNRRAKRNTDVINSFDKTTSSILDLTKRVKERKDVRFSESCSKANNHDSSSITQELRSLENLLRTN